MFLLGLTGADVDGADALRGCEEEGAKPPLSDLLFRRLRNLSISVAARDRGLTFDQCRLCSPLRLVLHTGQPLKSRWAKRTQ